MGKLLGPPSEVRAVTDGAWLRDPRVGRGEVVLAKMAERVGVVGFELIDQIEPPAPTLAADPKHPSHGEVVVLVVDEPSPLLLEVTWVRGVEICEGRRGSDQLAVDHCPRRLASDAGIRVPPTLLTGQRRRAA